MKSFFFIGVFFLINGFVRAEHVKDTLVLDGFAVEIERDSLAPLTPLEIESWHQDFKKMPPFVIGHAALGSLIGFSQKPFEMIAQKDLLSSREGRISDDGWQLGVCWNATAMLNNHIGVGVGLAYSQFAYHLIAADMPSLIEGQKPYKLSCQGDQVQWIIQQPVGPDLFELDTLKAPIQDQLQKVGLFQVPFLLSYVQESRSQLWRAHFAMGVLGQRANLSSASYDWISQETLIRSQDPAKKVWSTLPMVRLQLDRSFSSKNNIFLQINGVWPRNNVTQGGGMVRIPPYWISFGWSWKFNNNPYIRAL